MFLLAKGVTSYSGISLCKYEETFFEFCRVLMVFESCVSVKIVWCRTQAAARQWLLGTSQSGGDRTPSPSRIPVSDLTQSCAHFEGHKKQIVMNQMLPLLRLQVSIQSGGENWGWHVPWKSSCVTLHKGWPPDLPCSRHRGWSDPTAGLCVAAPLQQNNCPLSYYIVTCDLEMIHPFYLSLDSAIILHFSQIVLGMLMCLHRDIFCKINLRTFKMNEHI